MTSAGRGGAGRIAVMVAQELGALNPSFALARLLERRGHEIVYLGLPMFAGYVASQGFRQVSLDFSIETIEQLAEARKLEELAALFDRVIARVRAVLRREAAAVCLVEPYCPWFWTAAHLEGIPSVSVCPNYSHVRNAQVPPYSSSLIPRPGLWSRAMCLLQWVRLARERSAEKRARTIGCYAHFEQLAARHGIAFACSEPRSGPRVLLPEIVLAPRAFDFPNRLGRCYAGLCVDHERTEDAAPIELAGGGPLIYCSLGTLGFLYPHRGSLFQKLVNVLRRSPDLRLVLHVGDEPLAADVEVPPNVMVRDKVPQLAVLRRTAAFVTHAGLGSVKEAIAFEVPMLAVPCYHDQPGNAARIVARGLGVRASVEHVGERELEAGIRRLIDDPGYRRRLRALKDQIAAEESPDGGIAIIEAALDARAGAHARVAGGRA